MEEQEYLTKLYNIIERKEYIHQDTIDIIESRFPENIILHYYLGCYYQQQNSIYEAIEKFKLCIDNKPLFTPPYFELSKHIKSPLKLYKLFSNIYCEDTYNGKSDKKEFNLNENILICSFIGKKLFDIHEWIHCINLYTKLYEHIKDISYTDISYDCIIAWKNITQNIGDIYMKLDPNKAIFYYHKGLSKQNYNIAITRVVSEERLNFIHNHDKKLVVSYLFSVNYTNSENAKLICIDRFFNKVKFKGECVKHNKKKIGYIISNDKKIKPFLVPFLNHYKKSKFEIYCYNIDEMSDKTCADIFNIIRNIHKIDIIVDFVFLNEKIIETLAQSPAPVIINYLGYPNSTRLTSYTHFLTDKTINPVLNEKIYTEKIIYIPFSICWSLPTEIEDQEINYTKSDKIRIGIFNSLENHNPELRNIWKCMSESEKYDFYVYSNENVKILQELFYCIKNVKFLPVPDSFENFLLEFNNIDIILDTYPCNDLYTTCCGLYMGLPPYCVYNEKNRHYSNVSGGILKHINETDFICETLQEFKKRVMVISINREKEQAKRKLIRKKFISMMNPDIFMFNYENAMAIT